MRRPVTDRRRDLIAWQGRWIGILLVERRLDFCLVVGDNFHIMDCGSVAASGPIAGLNDQIEKNI